MTKIVEISLGKAGSVTVDVAKLEANPQVVEYIFNYGLKQMLNDVHASEKDPDAKKALSLKKLDSLYAGQVAQTRVGGGGDPVLREMRQMAESDVKAKLKALGKKISDYSKETLAVAYAKQLEAGKAGYEKAAKAKLAIKADAPQDIDLDELFG